MALEPNERGPADVVERVASQVEAVVTRILDPEEFRHLPRRSGKQLSQILASFAQEQFLQLPVLLQRQHVIVKHWFQASQGRMERQIQLYRTSLERRVYYNCAGLLFTVTRFKYRNRSTERITRHGTEHITKRLTMYHFLYIYFDY